MEVFFGCHCYAPSFLTAPVRKLLRHTSHLKSRMVMGLFLMPPSSVHSLVWLTRTLPHFGHLTFGCSIFFLPFFRVPALVTITTYSLCTLSCGFVDESLIVSASLGKTARSAFLRKNPLSAVAAVDHSAMLDLRVFDGFLAWRDCDLLLFGFLSLDVFQSSELPLDLFADLADVKSKKLRRFGRSVAAVKFALKQDSEVAGCFFANLPDVAEV